MVLLVLFAGMPAGKHALRVAAGAKLRRPLGLYAFLYAFAHFLIFAGLDYRFDLTFIPDAILEKPFILLGLAALYILTLLAITSFVGDANGWKRIGNASTTYLPGCSTRP